MRPPSDFHTSGIAPGDLGLLISGNVVSTLGNAVYLIAVTLLLKEMTESALMLGLFQFVALAPGFLLSPVIGVVVDRVARHRIIVLSDLYRAVLMILAGLALMVPALRIPSVILVVAFLAGIGHALFIPAVHALLPGIVPPERLQTATGLRAAGSQAANLAGNAVGGALYVLLGGPVLFVLNGLSFLASAVQELFIRGGREAPDPGDRRSSHFTMARVGLTTVVRDRPLRSLLLSQAGLFLVSPVLVIALPFLVIDDLGMPEAALGGYLALAVAGGIVAFVLLRLLPLHALLRKQLPGVAYFGLAGAFAAVGLAPGPLVLAVVAVVSGYAAGLVYLVAVTWIQVRCDSGLHGRIFAVMEAGNSALAPTGYLFAGILLELLGAEYRWVLFVVVAAAAFLRGLVLVRDRPRSPQG